VKSWTYYDEQGVYLAYRWPGLPMIATWVSAPQGHKLSMVPRDIGDILRHLFDVGLVAVPEPCEATRCLEELWEW
jgi:hypothetical protein